MGAGGAASESIFFVAAIVLATAFVGVFATVSNELGRGVENRGSTLAKELKTDITIINDPAQMNFDDPSLILYVKNSGSTNLRVAGTEVILDGQITAQSSLSYDVLQSSDDNVWTLGHVLQITRTGVISNGDHVVRVVAETGIEAAFEWNET